ncbi:MULTISPECIES: DUF1611 domain-containing protein [Prauserella salsuginis group]|uniref:DUF1611 domain-containing protein n=1 Tax=Prauserella salsuginis TaxID=387889 RepID=A0ABW6G1W3_9PSEU|nr:MULTISPECIES: DUF1611 domain-containing protein [Prauserella salsuginis group]MCR3722281.1 Molybdopterin-guanine dinucleotide biosynthesis protein [Prauserella flava]MCR3736279.1 Molybdopterin-guanine dinucleotide biosynthesis protein [Prauserella salsuginis]
MTVSTEQDRTLVPPTWPEAAPSPTRLSPDRLRRAKKAYTTRFVAAGIDASPEGYGLLDGPDVTPQPGEVVLARVEAIGMHKRLESPVGRRQTLFPGDEILVAYGHRYAPDQFEAVVPGDLGPAHLVAAGGIAALATDKHRDIEDATAIRPLGLLADAHGVVALRRHASRALLPDTTVPARTAGPAVIGVVGTSMNSGKSTTAGSLIRGLARSGLRVAAGKVTGTGAGGDPHGFVDAGASEVLDFTDFGFPTTFRLAHDEVRAVLLSLVTHLSDPGTDVVVLELADGLYQEETARLLADPLFARVVDRVVFAADGAAGAAGGVALLAERGVPVGAVSGVLTSAPLAMREARSVLDVPVIDTLSLAEPDVATALL